MGNKIIWGITALSHDAAITVVKGDQILFGAHAERYSRVKNDFYLNNEIVKEAMQFGYPEQIVWYEKPWLKKTRQAYSGQWKSVFSKDDIPYFYLQQFLNKPMGLLKKTFPKITYALHHRSHAAAGAYTSPYDEACVVVLDAIGEWNTCTIWKFENNNLELVSESKYPHSFGLLYSAFTQRCELKPNEEEYIMMGMAAYGEPKYKDIIYNDFIKSVYPLKLKQNVHAGIGKYLPGVKLEDLSASIQSIADDIIEEHVKQAMLLTGMKNVVYQGGVALNCVSNTSLLKHTDNIWIMPNPGDAGNSLGAAALVNKQKLDWQSPYLGTDIKGKYPIKKIIKELERKKICGVANGRAEFGPRALGNRSLLADPRGGDIKDKVNEIKRRQKFRPFAPAILKEHLHKYFELDTDDSPYMQFVCKAKPETVQKFPAIVHFDNTARVQTVGQDDNTGFRALLEKWYEKTGCPILLNTSLNIRGEPLVNNESQAKDFEEKYNIKIYTQEEN